MSENRIPMTVFGRQQLQDELRHLKTVERPKVIAAIEEARAHGDLKENAEYHAAREKQGFVEGRINEISSKLVMAEVIDPKMIKQDKVVFGATVTFVDTETDDEKTYQIVGEDEADLKKNKIGITAPLSRSMLGKKIGEVFQLHTSHGIKEFEILNIQYL